MAKAVRYALGVLLRILRLEHNKYKHSGRNPRGRLLVIVRRNYRVKTFHSVLAMLIIMFLSFGTMAAVEVHLPSDRQIHHLDLDHEDDIMIYVSENAILHGHIKSDGDITFIANQVTDVDEAMDKVSITLSSTLNITGSKNDLPRDLVLKNFSRMIFSTPIKLDRYLVFDAANNAEVEFYKDLALSQVRGEIPTDAEGSSRIYIGGGVTVDAMTWDSKIGQGSFYLEGSSTINTSFMFKVEASRDITLFGTINTGIAMVDGRGKASVQVHSMNGIHHIGGFAFSLIAINGDQVNLHKDISYLNAFSARGRVINLYGITIAPYEGDVFGSGFGNVYIAPYQIGDESTINSYGATVKGNIITIASDLNDYGFEYEADIIEFPNQ